MKKLLILIAIAFVACNSPKDPPDEQLYKQLKAEQAKRDSLNNIATIKIKS